jgi:hypothetical protein
MKRTFTNFLEDLDAKEGKNVPRGRIEDLRRWNDSEKSANARGEHIGTNARENGRETYCTLQHATSGRSANQEEVEVSKAALEKVRQAIALMNEGLEPGFAAEEGTRCSGLARPDGGPLLARSSPSPCRPQDAIADDIGCLPRRHPDAAHPSEQLREHDLTQTLVRHADEEDEGEGESESEGQDEDDEEIDWDSVPISIAIGCRGPETAWTGEIYRQMQREMEEAAFMQLPGGDEDERAGGGGGRVQWMFKRVGEGI